MWSCNRRQLPFEIGADRFEIRTDRCQSQERLAGVLGGMSSSVASARTQFYHPVAGVNVRTLPLLPEQAFVLSRVDGQSDEAEIARATGIPAPQVFLHLQRLEELGAVRRPASIAPPKYGRAAAQASDVKATPKAPGPVPALARPTHAPGATTTAPAPAPETDKVVTTPAPTGPATPRSTTL